MPIDVCGGWSPEVFGKCVLPVGHEGLCENFLGVKFKGIYKAQYELTFVGRVIRQQISPQEAMVCCPKCEATVIYRILPGRKREALIELAKKCKCGSITYSPL